MAKARVLAVSTEERAEVCQELVQQQRLYTMYQKSRIMNNNRLVLCVATELGYAGAQSTEADRKRLIAAAEKLIKDIDKDPKHGHRLVHFVRENLRAIGSFEGLEQEAELGLTKLAKRLPIYDWVKHPDQKGFGFKSLGKVVGECGDLANYSNPGKVWRRMGCTPYTCKRLGLTLMGETWRKKTYGVLTSEEWTEYGYNPIRRSIVHIISECLLQLNKSHYRARYDFKKAEAIEKHPDWAPICKGCDGAGRKEKPCSECDGVGMVETSNSDVVDCIECKGTGKAACEKCRGKKRVLLRVHKHGMLLMGKRLLKHLWMAWNPDYAWPSVEEERTRIQEANWKESQEEVVETTPEAEEIA